MCDHLNFENIRTSLQGQAIYKDECTKCFIDQKSAEGVDVCLMCFQGGCSVGFKHSKEHFQKTSHPIVLNMRQVCIKDEASENKSEEDKKITKLAIGKPGGIDFSDDRWECWTVLKCLACDTELDKTAIAELVDSLVIAQSAFFQSGVDEWELQINQCEHTLTLAQTDVDGGISNKSLAHCRDCALSTNLWLCMTCGNLGCGRKMYDGSGGNNHGVDHNTTTGHPLACKMGTITPEGKASLHCYKCDEEVLDENLAAHLRHFGIDIAEQVKTEKTIAEMELERNLNLTLSKAVEKGRTLVPQFGANLTGLTNLGNSCYMNSVIQALFDIQTFKDNYGEKGLEHLQSCAKNPAECHLCQFSKLAYGLYSGDYSQKKERSLPVPEGGDASNPEIEIYQDGITPRMFKTLMGKGHAEFSRSTQQDAYEYLQHLFTLLHKSEKSANLPDATRLFDFDLNTRLQCQKCKGVKYSKSNGSGLLLFAKKPESEEGMETDEEKDKAKEDATVDDFEKLPEIDFWKCLEPYTSEEMVNYNCPTCKEETTFSKSLKFDTFPEYLVICLQRFTFEDWVPKKLENPVSIPQENIDLGPLKTQSVEGEVLLPEEELAKSSEPEVNPAFLTQLESMGFPTLGCKHALVNTGNASAEAAMDWLMGHLDDPAITQPLTGSDASSGDAGVSAESVAMVTSMGFDEKLAKIALKNTEGNVERAIDYLFSHDPSELLAESENVAVAKPTEKFVSEGAPVYEIKSFITHLGKSVGSGHYVCHVKRGDDWIYFNDDKVATSTNPPHRGAYVYFLRKMGSKY